MVTDYIVAERFGNVEAFYRCREASSKWTRLNSPLPHKRSVYIKYKLIPQMKLAPVSLVQSPS